MVTRFIFRRMFFCLVCLMPFNQAVLASDKCDLDDVENLRKYVRLSGATWDNFDPAIKLYIANCEHTGDKILIEDKIYNFKFKLALSAMDDSSLFDKDGYVEDHAVNPEATTTDLQ